MRAVTSVSVAAGFHGGDPSILRATIRRAKSQGIAIGAHPGFADLAGFGRREIALAPQQAEDLVAYQVAVVAGMAATEGCRLQHVKPHGALYKMAARDRMLGSAIARGIAAVDRTLIVIGPGGSALLSAAEELDLESAVEVFADRAYNPDGSLVSREKPFALLTDPAVVVPRAVRMVMTRQIVAVDGTTIPSAVDTICIHSDTAGSAALASAVRTGLEAAGILVQPLREP